MDTFPNNDLKDTAKAILGNHYNSYFTENTTVEKLHGGLNGSLVLKVSDGSKGDFVLRKNTPQINKNFILELEIFELFSKFDLAPKIYYSSPSEGIVLMEYIEDDFKGKVENRKKFIQSLGTALCKSHQIPLEETFYNPSVYRSKNIFDASLELIDEIRAQRYFCPLEDTFLRQMGYIVPLYDQDSDLALNHRDTNFGNVLYDKNGKIKFIDFEVSSIDNKYVDLATIDNFYLYSDADRVLFLESYFQREPKETELDKLKKMVPFTHLYHAVQLALIAKDKDGLSQQEIDGLLPLYEMEKLIQQGTISLFDDKKNITKLIYALIFEVKRLLYR